MNNVAGRDGRHTQHSHLYPSTIWIQMQDTRWDPALLTLSFTDSDFMASH